ncbi:MAG TPA: hypothetical protein VFG30_44350 [Polyangiales bacterium]|nr:hypothetical protein [Polyangiales bacterium]
MTAKAGNVATTSNAAGSSSADSSPNAPASPGAGGAAPTADGAGSSATAGSNAQAGAPAPAASAAADPPPDRGPYFTSGPWHGFFWTAYHGPGTTLTSTNFTAPMFEMPICIRGSVALTPDNSGNAILGMNLNQANSLDGAPLTIVPTRAGVQVDFTNNAGSPLRVMVQGLDGATNERARWCAALNSSTKFVPWSQFNTTCWDGLGSPYLHEPISTAMLLVPGTMGLAIAYDVCLKNLAEAEAPPMPAAGSGGAASAGRSGSPAAGSGGVVAAETTGLPAAGSGGVPAAGRGGSPAAGTSG